MKTEPALKETGLCTLRISVADMVALRVRAKVEGVERPQYLYQRLPVSAMTLFATIPQGDFSVSIPRRSEIGVGYPVLKSPPPGDDGIVVVYPRRTNGRYEAASVLFLDREYGMAEFHEAASVWARANVGEVSPAPGRYIYFVPGRESWGVIVGNSGFLALDCSTVSSDLNPELLARRSDPWDAAVRAPVYRGDTQAPGNALPVFAQLELTFDRQPGPQSPWIRVTDYLKARAVRAKPPALLVPDFRQWLECLARESGFQSWLFRPGMFFGEGIEWWGDGNPRRTEHEGIDFAEGRRPDGCIRSIPEETPVRAIADGEVAAFLDDFLGKTVVVRHASIVDPGGDVFYTLYSHIRPETQRLEPVAKGQILGRVHKAKSAGAPAHLHLTGAWIPPSIPPGEIRMTHIDPAFLPVVLTNFNELL